MKLGEILIKLRADLGSFDPDIGRAVASLGRISSAGKAAGGGIAAVAIGLSIAGLAAVKMAAEFESSFARVRKTVDSTKTNLSALRGSILDLTRTVPLAATELASIAQMGAQMGIDGDANLKKFTETVARLGVTADMTGEQAAQMLARIATANNIPIDQIDRLGSSLVFVADRNNATANEVLRATMMMQGLGATAGLTATEMFGLSAALVSTGLRIESMGNATGRMARDIGKFVREADKLKVLQDLTKGVTGGQDFAKLWDTSKAEALVAVFAGLSQQGDRAFDTLEKLGWQNLRVSGTALNAARAVDTVKKAIGDANEGFSKNTALTEKSGIMFGTFESNSRLLKNAVAELGIAFGTDFLPNLADTIKLLTSGVHKATDFVNVLSRMGVLRAAADHMLPFIAAMRQLNAVQNQTPTFQQQIKGTSIPFLMQHAQRSAAFALDDTAPGLIGPNIPVRGESRPSDTRDEESAKALEDYRKEVEKLGKELSGSKAEEGMRQLTDAFMANRRAIEGGPGFFKLIEQIKQLREEGAKVPPVFEEILKKAKGIGDPNDPNFIGPKNWEGDLLRMNELRSGAMARMPFLGQTGGVAVNRMPDETLAALNGLGLTAEQVAEAESKLKADKYKELTKSTFDWSKALSGVADMFQVLGISADSTLGRILGALTSAAAAGQGFANAMRGADGQMLAFKDMDHAGMIQSTAGVLGAFAKATDHAEAWKRAMGGALTGAQFGSQIGEVFGPKGKLIGMIGGALIGGIAGIFNKPEWAKVGEEAGKILGTHISRATAEKIIEKQKEIGGSLRLATLLSLPDVIKDSKKHVGDFSGNIRDLMLAVSYGSISVSEGFETMNELWSMAREEAKATGETFNLAMLEMIVDSRNMGVQIPEILDHVLAATERAAKGLDKVFSSVTYHRRFKKDESGNVLKDDDGNPIEDKHWTEQEGGLHMETERSAKAQATIFATTFAATLREHGLVAAVEMMKGSFDKLRDVMLKSGFETIFGEVLGGVGRLFELMENEAFRGAAEAAQGLAETMAGLIEAGYLTRDAFEAFGVTAVDAFDQALAAGESELDALLAILPLLYEIHRAHELYNYQLTEEQQRLMAIAEANGIAFPDDPILQVRDAIYELIEAITGIPREVNVKINVKENHSGPGGGGDTDTGEGGKGKGQDKAPDEHAAMGFYSPKLPKDTLIQAHTGEEVLITPAGGRRADRVDVDAMLSAVAQAAAGANRGADGHTVVNVYIDGHQLRDFVTRASKTGGVRIHPSSVRQF